MNINLQIKNIVLVGAFQAQNYDKYFFIKNQIVKEEEISPLSVFNAIGGLQLNTDSFQVVIQPNQIIITDLKPQEGKNDIAKIIEKIILSASLTKITAMGFNFHWYAKDGSKTIETLSKELFYNEKVKLLSDYFNTPDSQYGLYASVNFKNSRLKLDVKPSSIQKPDPANQTDLIAFIFNFHFDLSKDSNDMIFESLSNYQSYLNESDNVISKYR